MSEHQNIEAALIEYLHALNPNERVNWIDDMIHRFQFERRLALLTDEQKEHMASLTPSASVRETLKKLEGTPAFEEKITEIARSVYFRQCAWVDYLNNGGTPPIPPRDFCPIS